MKYLSIDYGDKRIGFAISDELGKFARQHSFILNKGANYVTSHILGICQKEKIEKVVLGIPDVHNPKNEKQLEVIRSFHKKLKNKLSIQIDYWNEEFTSIQARENINNRKKRIKNKEEIDMESARIILQEYLNNKNYE